MQACMYLSWSLWNDGDCSFGRQRILKPMKKTKTKAQKTNSEMNAENEKLDKMCEQPEKIG
jgi:hypothetical protein